MAQKISHQAKLALMDLTIAAMRHTSRSTMLSAIFRQTYHLNRDGRLIFWGGAILAFGLGGFLVGYLAFFLIG
jgi:hypothetical protein